VLRQHDGDEGAILIRHPCTGAESGQESLPVCRAAVSYRIPARAPVFPTCFEKARRMRKKSNNIFYKGGRQPVLFGADIIAFAKFFWVARLGFKHGEVL